jgi:SAM-dependent methyltransferase
MSATTTSPAHRWAADPDLLRCPACHGSLVDSDAGLACPSCGTDYPERDGVLVVNELATDDNKIAQDFYNSALWPKFRFWERVFWVCNGGERKSREVILRHLPTGPGLRLLDVAIGDGVYTSWLPADWSIVGVDVSKAQLSACAARNAERSDLRLMLGEAENLPFHDRRFDAVLSIGGFNHFNDPEHALREMARVAKCGAAVVVSDELPDLTDRMIGHRIGLPGLDRWFVANLLNLGDAFTDLVERHRKMDVAAIGARVLNDCVYEAIWRKGGYVLYGTAP